jgi:PPOX class probable F420-dependent enzyme
MAGLSPEQILFLEGQRVARLATVDEDGKPHVVPVCFACVAGLVYTPIDEKPKRVTATALRRVRNILAHPDVCLVADRYDDDWTRLAWLQVHGQASLATDAAERGTALTALRARYPQYLRMDLESYPLIRIAPTRVVAWAARPSPSSRG